MAKLPSRRRGIMLDPRADTAEHLTQLPPQPTLTGAPDGTSAANPELLAQLGRMSADQEARWRQQEEQVQIQVKQLQSQEEQIARLTRQLTRRRGTYFALLALAGVAALGWHFWPSVQEVAEDLHRARAKVSHIAPELRAVHEQVNALTAYVGQMAGTMASVQTDIASVHSELGALRKTVDTPRSPVRNDTVGAGSTVHALPRNASAMIDPYRGRRPMIPW